MNKDTTVLDVSRAPFTDELSEFLRNGARELLFNAVQAELDSFLEEYAALRTADGRKAVVRNGFLPYTLRCTEIFVLLILIFNLSQRKCATFFTRLLIRS
jgi:hypothetical protein